MPPVSACECGDISYGPLNEYSQYCISNPSFYRPNVLFLTYENMKRDPIREILKIVDFLKLPSAELKDPTSNKFQHVLKESGIDAMKDYVQENYKTALGGANETEWLVSRMFV